MGDYLLLMSADLSLEPWPFVPYPCAQMKSYGFNVDINRCSARTTGHCRPMDVKTTHIIGRAMFPH